MSMLELMTFIGYSVTIFGIGYMLGVNANRQK